MPANYSLQSGLQKGFIDANLSAPNTHTPTLVTNDKESKSKVLSSLTSLITSCDAFQISVAFIASSGIASLFEALDEAASKGIKGEILTSTYLTFTQPQALRQLLKYENISLRIASEEGFHAKGYLFHFENEQKLLLGSSNLTQNALATNKEWNLLLHSTDNGSLFNQIQLDFESSFKKATAVTLEWLSDYETVYAAAQTKRSIVGSTSSPSLNKVQPNKMQRDALENIENLRAKGVKKALLISATGTGKTYLSAFDVLKFKPKKFLFVVHRLTIAQKALETYRNLLGDSKTYGIYSGGAKEIEADYIFCTIQTLSKSENLECFKRTEFDYIVIDETHRAGGASYQRIMEFFNPRFILGMTATPERTDGWDVFKAFNYNIAYEIRLHEALENKMLVPFHYFGISDLTINGETIEDKSDFDKLTAKERLNHIFSTIDKYGCDDAIPKGLVFCSRKDECVKLAQEFNLHGKKSIALTGDSSETERAAAIERLEANDDSKIDYIFTVDIFNEGVDIPSVNLVIMLRPTQSAIIFVQQLGRGLRTASNKDYLTVIDFIGNYSNNYLVPIALFGDNSYNKDTLRNLISKGNNELPGASTVAFDKITKEKIYQAINSANLQTKKELVKDYQLLKYKLGRIPMMCDFIEHGSRDAQQYPEYAGSYLNFIRDLETDFVVSISKNAVLILKHLGLEVLNAKRVEEAEILRTLISSESIHIPTWNKDFEKVYGYIPNDQILISAIDNINLKFATSKQNGAVLPINDLFKFDLVDFDNNHIRRTKEFAELLEEQAMHSFLLDHVQYAIHKFKLDYNQVQYIDGFQLYKKYSRKDTLRILNWKQNVVAQNVGGYKVSKDRSNCPIFVNYHKEEDISSSTKYDDGFISQSRFKWMSKNNRRLNSPDVKSILSGTTRLPLFIKKHNGEGDDFYYMGDVTPIPEAIKQSEIDKDDGSKSPVVSIEFEMQHVVNEDIFKYLTTE